MTQDIIAIDGPAGSGKSTVARALAERLGWAVLDTGAMYRAVTSETLHRRIDPHDDDAVSRIANGAVIDTLPRVRINGRDVHDEIRTEAINVAVSIVAANPGVRSALVQRQRTMAEQESGGLVVEGRDISTVVFPHARVKIFLTASMVERSRRRSDEAPGSVARRDQVDASRETSPLRQAVDAVALDTTRLDVDQVVEEIIRCLQNTASS